jgi:hypothetical protein
VDSTIRLHIMPRLRMSGVVVRLRGANRDNFTFFPLRGGWGELYNREVLGLYCLLLV